MKTDTFHIVGHKQVNNTYFHTWCTQSMGHVHITRLFDVNYSK